MRLDDMLRPRSEGKAEAKGNETGLQGVPQSVPHDTSQSGISSDPGASGERPTVLISDGSALADDLGNVPTSEPGGKAEKSEVEGFTAERVQTLDMHTAEPKAKPAVPLTAKATPSTPNRNGNSPRGDSRSADSRTGDFSSFRWHASTPTQAKPPVWEALPFFNRFLAVSGATCLALALARLVIPPVAQSAQRAYYPYTAAGKQELCATHLRSIATAMAAYARDNEGRFPPLDYQGRSSGRATWVSLVSGRGEEGIWSCPVGPRLSSETENIVSSYAMNPVAATATATELDDASRALLLADGGSKHDVSLLPPYPTWPSFASRQADGGVDAEACNVALRHGGSAMAVYADGHAEPLSGSGTADPALWGGSAVLRRARTRLGERGPQAREMMKRLRAGDVGGAASYLAAHKSALQPVVGDFAALWRLNTGEHSSDSVEEMGWHLARAARQAGDGSLLQQCDAEQTRRSRAAVQAVGASAWESNDMVSNPGLRCQRPSIWQYQQESQGRYYRAYVRSGLPSVFAVLEVGQRNSYVTPQPIDWRGSENDLRRRYGKSGYKQIGLTGTTLCGNGASQWDYELDKAGGPRLRKRYIGYTDGWNSYVVGFTAPAKDWALWQPTFDKILGSVEHVYFGRE